MHRRSFGLLVAVVFVMGLVAPSAVAAGSHPSAYFKVAGGSASCTMVAASINDATNMAGGRTSNFAGCNSSNAPVNMAAGRLGVAPWGAQNVNGFAFSCTDVPGRIVNPVTASTIAKGLAIDFGQCPTSRGKHFGRTFGYRKINNGTWENSPQVVDSPHKAL